MDTQYDTVQGAQRLPMQEDLTRSAVYRWLRKPVYASMVLDDFETPKNWGIEGIAQLSYTHERTLTGTTSLRFTTAMRDDAYLARDAAQHGTFSGESGGGTSAVLRFEVPQDWTAYNRIAVWIYPHPAGMRRCTPNLQLEPYFRPTIAPYDFISFPRPTFHVQHLRPGEWNYVVWEIANYPRTAITSFIFSQELFGHEPGTAGIVIYDIDRIELQRVDADSYEGWAVAPGRIAYNHVGYKPEAPKVALASTLSAAHFQVLDAATGEPVLTRAVEPCQTAQGLFQRLDFSEVRAAGRYVLRAGDLMTRPFQIGPEPWRGTVDKALNFYYCERCNFDVPGLHGECHKDLQGTHGDVTKVVNGGWHDAADFSQGCHQTGISIYAMLTWLQQLKARQMHPKLQARLVEEVLWGLDWFLKSRFGDGYRMIFQVARIYTDNELGTLDDSVHPAERITWLNLHGAAVEALAYETLKDAAPEVAQRCLEAALEDWAAATSGAPEDRESPDYLVGAWGVLASLALQRITGEARYAESAVAYGEGMLACQERAMPEGMPLAGYFHADAGHTAMVRHDHLGFEESPVEALRALCEAFADHPRWADWYGAVVVHAEHFQKAGTRYTAPYGMLANGLYSQREIEAIADPNLRAYQLRHLQAGERLTDDLYLKRFPVWRNHLFHGATAAQLSQALALMAASLLRHDLAGEALVDMQLQWVFGGNPFCQSLMYGEGYDYVPLHAHRQADFVGALPVGMDCMRNDEPYWPPSNYATHKEIWVVPVSRFLWTAAYAGLPALVRGRVRGGSGPVVFRARGGDVDRACVPSSEGAFAIVLPAGVYEVTYADGQWEVTVVSGAEVVVDLDAARPMTLASYAEAEGTGAVRVTVAASGRGRHTLALRIFNGTTPEPGRELDLGAGGTATLNWGVTVADSQIPWVVVVVPDGDLGRRQELTGSQDASGIVANP